MDHLKIYIPPQVEISCFTPRGELCAGYDSSWAQTGDPTAYGPSGGIELPDDIWGDNSGGGGIELPDDNM